MPLAMNKINNIIVIISNIFIIFSFKFKNKKRINIVIGYNEGMQIIYISLRKINLRCLFNQIIFRSTKYCEIANKAYNNA